MAPSGTRHRVLWSGTMTVDLTDRNVVITGAGSGIGRAACDVFAAAGAHVLAVDLHEDTASAAAEAVGGTPLAGDVSDAGFWDDVAAAAEERGGADIAYLNAGVYGHQGPIDEVDLATYQRTVGANIGGVVLGVRALVPGMRSRGTGAIVATASVAGIVAFDGNPLYTMTKQAVTGFVRAIAPSLAADGITIDAVCPAIVDTPMTAEAAGGQLPEAASANLISPETIARTALELATTEGTGRCRAVRQQGGRTDWTFPTWHDLAAAPSID